MPKILVVDDEPDLEVLLRQHFRRKIRSGTLELVFARDGIEALEVLEQNADCDVVLSDINMPRMDGLTLLQKIGNLERDIYSVMVSAYGDMENIRSAMNYGAFDFLTKPINFEDLEATIQKTLKVAKQARSAQSNRDKLMLLRKELALATTMQESVLPVRLPSAPAFACYANMYPAKEVSGDFYDAFSLEGGSYGLAIADVSGKGVPAALFMMVASTLLKGIALRGGEPGACMDELNRLLSKENRSNMFVTLLYGLYDPSSSSFSFSNAGHNPPLLLRADGAVEEVRVAECNAPLGIVEQEFEVQTLELANGDSIFLYTDGVTEAFDTEGEQFGLERLQNILSECAKEDLENIGKRVIETVQKFSEGMPQSDDITFLIMRRV